MPGDATHGRRLADRAAGVGAQRAGTQRGGHRRRRTARRPARHAIQRPGVAHRLEGAVLVGRAHGELVHVQLAQVDGARRLQPAPRRCSRRAGTKPGQDLRAGGGLDPPGDEDVLEADGHAAQRARRPARRRCGRRRRRRRRAPRRRRPAGSCPAGRPGGRCDPGSPRPGRAPSSGARARPPASAAMVAPRSSGALTCTTAAGGRDDPRHLEEVAVAGGGIRQRLRRATASSPTSSGRRGQSNGTAWVIGSTPVVSSCRSSSM